MSEKKDEYWKELMGDDFTLKPTGREDGAPSPEEPAPEPAAPESAAPEPETHESTDIGPDILPVFDDKPQFIPEPDFTVEYVKPEEPAPEPEPTGMDVPEPPPEGQSRRSGRKKRDPVEDFEVNFDFDEEYADVEEKVVRRGRTKRTGCLSGIMMFLFIICVSVVLASLGWVWATDVLGLDGDDEPVEVVIPREIFHEEQRERENDAGETETVTVTVADMDAVADELMDKGLVRYKWLFKLFCRFAHADEKIEAGTYTLNMNYDYRALVKGMNNYSGLRDTIMLMIPEGYTITEIVNMMDENGVCPAEDLLDVLANYDFEYDFLDSSTLGDPKRLEGYLFPDTYEFYIDDDPEEVIERFLDNFERKWNEDLQAMAEELGYSLEDILKVASMIEKEAGADSERDSIASVIYNRLTDDGSHGTYGLLQIDATIYYAIEDTGEEFSTEIDSPYNTYLYPGLPVGPICNPGLASIRAALNPADTDYYYYALSKSGTHRFFETYSAFQNFVNSDDFGG